MSTLTNNPEPLESEHDTAATTKTGTRSHEARVREHFRDISEQWGNRYGTTAAKMSDLDLQLRRENVLLLLHSVLAEKTGCPWILDVGCGTGHVLEGLNELAGLKEKQIRVVGVDLVPEMVAVAARAHPSQRFLACDATALPFGPATLNVVTCIGVLEYLPDVEGCLGALHALLRPDGYLVVSFPNKWSVFRWLSKVEITLENALLAVLRKIQGRRATQTSSPCYKHTQWSVQAARQLLRNAGFEPEAARFNTYGLWGRVGRWRMSLWLSSYMSRRFGKRGFIARWSACTMVIRARKMNG